MLRVNEACVVVCCYLVLVPLPLSVVSIYAAAQNVNTARTRMCECVGVRERERVVFCVEFPAFCFG